MTQEDKELLVRDLSARLPYGVMAHFHDINVDDYDRIVTGSDIDSIKANLVECKPYLRSISSMTDEESKELENLYNTTANYICECIPIFNVQTLSVILDWFNAHQFDYRGLISKGLAIDKQLML